MGARFIRHAFKGHIEQKNYALTQAAYPHVLSLDADEALSEELKQSIRQAKSHWEMQGYYMNRLTNYCGTWIRHCGWYPDRKLRLFNSSKGNWGGINPHDKFCLHDGDTAAGWLKGNILHYSFRTRDEFRDRQKHYAFLGAAELHKKNAKAGWAHINLKPAVRFIRDYVIHAGFLDGRSGIVISKTAAQAVYWKYSQLKKLNKTK